MLVQGIAFVQGVILARLLCPEDFGLTAMLGIFLAVGSMFAEGGLGTALVVRGQWVVGSELERRVFRWNVGMAVGIYALLAIGAPWIAAFYHQPILRELTWVMGLSIILNAACVARSARLQREQEFGKLALVNGGAVLVSSIAGVGMASLGFGVWSIVGVGLAHGVVRLGGLVVSGQWVVGSGEVLTQRHEDTEVAFRKMLGFGMRTMASGLVHVVYVNLSQLLIGRFFSSAALGLYARGHRWAVLPGEVVNECVGRVALPCLAKGEASVKVKGISVEWWKVNVLLLWPGLVVLWIWAKEIVCFVLGAHWVECVPYMRILMVGQFFTPISNLALTRLKAAGRADLVLKTDFIKKPIGIAALLAGLPFGVAGLCWAKVADDIVEAVIDSAYTRHIRR